MWIRFWFRFCCIIYNKFFQKCSLGGHVLQPSPHHHPLHPSGLPRVIFIYGPLDLIKLIKFQNSLQKNSLTSLVKKIFLDICWSNKYFGLNLGVWKSSRNWMIGSSLMLKREEDFVQWILAFSFSVFPDFDSASRLWILPASWFRLQNFPTSPRTDFRSLQIRYYYY